MPNGPRRTPIDRMPPEMSASKAAAAAQFRHRPSNITSRAHNQDAVPVFSHDATIADSWNRVFRADANFVLFQQRLSGGFLMRAEGPAMLSGSYAASLHANYRAGIL